MAAFLGLRFFFVGATFRSASCEEYFDINPA